MSNDTFTEVSSQSWLSRIGGSVKGIFFGLILIVIAFGLLFWNEGRAVKRTKTLKEGGGAVIAINASVIDAGNEGQLVHLSGHADTTETLSDSTFGVSTQALKLIRTVEMYQWEEETSSETKKKVGGKTETVTTYNYTKEWSSSLNESGRFKHPEGHQNPSAMSYSSTESVAETITLGGFRLSPSLVARINNSTGLSIPADHAIPEALGNQARLNSGGFYIGPNPSDPQIGDLRITFSEVQPTDVSIVARQVSDTFEPYLTKVGGTIELLQNGTVSAEAMFQQAQQSNTIMTWVLRAVGFFLMFLGFKMLFGPLEIVADVLPLAGTIVGAGISVVSFLTALALSLLTIAIAWVVFRPLLGITLLVIVVAIVVLVVRKLKKVELPPLPQTP
ncbi:MAG: TMEM43 family protein [Acidobacteriota bacterium]